MSAVLIRSRDLDGTERDVSMSETGSPGARSTPKYFVPALDKGLDILELLSESSASMSQVDIARALGRNVSEIFRTLSALEARGYIRRTLAAIRLTLKLFNCRERTRPMKNCCASRRQSCTTFQRS